MSIEVTLLDHPIGSEAVLFFEQDFSSVFDKSTKQVEVLR
jgi:hypothetical protein